MPETQLNKQNKFFLIMEVESNIKSQGPARTGPGINVRLLIQQSLMTMLKGNKALVAAINEPINNSFDHGATEVRLRFGTYKGKQALFIMDDARGFNESGVDSMLSFGFSDKSQYDTQTIGVNGTGSKAVLGLGDLKETKVNIISFSDTFKHGIHLDFNLDYLFDLADGKAVKPKKQESISRVDFWNGWKRETGTNFILTGFSSKVLNQKTLHSALSEALTPLNVKKVKLGVEDKYSFVPLKKIEGSRYDFSYTGEILGNFVFDLYYGGPNDGPKLCGKENYIRDYSDFLPTLSSKQKEQIGKIWKSTGGFAYIENINIYRMTDGSFNKDFYENGACEELVSMFKLVGEELDELEEKINDEKLAEEQKEVISRLVEASNKISPQPYSSGRGLTQAAMPSSHVEGKIYIVPRVLFMKLGESLVVTLHNNGTEKIKLEKCTWLTSSFVNIEGSGDTVRITAKKIGQSKIIVNGDGWYHEIALTIIEPTNNPYIFGPKYMNLGVYADYEIANFKKQLTWFVETSHSHLKDVYISAQTSSSATVHVSKEATLSQFLLKCKDSNDQIVAEKRIIVSDRRSQKAPLVLIGGKYYKLDFKTLYKDALAQIDDDDPEDYPSIVINSLHPFVRYQPISVKMKEYITAICTVAVSHQIEKDGLSTMKAMNVLWQAINEYRNTVRKK